MWVRVKERTRARTLAFEGACVRERLRACVCVLAGVRACARETAHVCVCVRVLTRVFPHSTYLSALSSRCS